MVYTKEQGISALNTLAQSQESWFFLVDYLASRWFVTPISDLIKWNLAFKVQSPIIPPEVSCFEPEGLGLESTTSQPPILISSVHLPPLSTYQKAIDLVQDEERKGNSFLCNLTFGSHITLTGGGLLDAYVASHGLYKLYVADKRIAPESFVVFSPERFIRIQGSVIESSPMKGTIDYTDPQKDTQTLAELLQDPKEDAEHRTIVDLIRNDLGIISNQVWVDSYRYGQKIILPHKNLWATSSTIKGQLPLDWRSHFGDYLSLLLPAGSITGAPKRETCRIISDAEIEPRGYYTGVAGIGGPWGVESWVLIRFIEEHRGTVKFRSGGGITIYSDVHKEYRELEAKIGIPRG